MLQTPGELPSLPFAVPVAAGVAGVVLSFVLSPFELIKVSLPVSCYQLTASLLPAVVHLAWALIATSWTSSFM